MNIIDFLRENNPLGEPGLTCTEAAQAMGLSLARLKQLLKSGQAPKHFRWNTRMLVFKHSDINAWKQGREKCKGNHPNRPNR